MCGIAGFTTFRNKNSIIPENRQKMTETLELLRLRGPDGSGIESGKNYIFGHTRLAIIDPAAGAQPMISPDTGAVIIYNGEVYNHREIRRELESLGHSFSTNCDTETVLKAYQEWGEEAVNIFNGLFAFAVYDPRKNIIFAARDRLGIKPFYYHKGKDSLSFASTIPAVLKLSGIKPEADIESLSHYLSTSKLLFGEKTMLKDIFSLRPGRAMTIDLASGNFSIKQYWKRPVMSSHDRNIGALPFAEAALKTGELLKDSVMKRLMSDVPVGSFLSGGLDSSIIAHCLAEGKGSSMPFFCAVSDDDSASELAYAKLAADSEGAKLYEIMVGADSFAANWDFLIGQKGMPLSTPNEVSIYFLAKALSRDCKVTLTGEGADEIFGGYVQPHFSAFDFDRCARTPEEADTLSPFGMSMYMQYGRNFFINDTDHYLATCSWMSFLAKEDLFVPEIWNDTLAQDEALFGFYEDFFEHLKDCSSFDKRMHLHAEFNLENLLSRVDNSTMSASVEARVPFNDHRLAEFAFTMPDSYKMAWKTPAAAEQGKDLTTAEIDRRELLETKRLPREAFRNALPREIIERKKMSFPVPFEKWFSGELLPEIKELCLESPLAKNLFNAKAIENMAARKDRNLWLIANLCKWGKSLGISG
ncbi:MAG: asparagine synthase (glutamine-hydrolyzing) [Candidatus Izemoplasmatales bacterium]|nr:asparagine synthase (glutamine-hydrolyzing) [Candidatus Izemoplasmatales bacterium]